MSVLEAKFRSGKLFWGFRFFVLSNAARRVRFPLVDSFPGRLVNSPIENQNETQWEIKGGHCEWNEIEMI